VLAARPAALVKAAAAVSLARPVARLAKPDPLAQGEKKKADQLLPSIIQDQA